MQRVWKHSVRAGMALAALALAAAQGAHAAGTPSGTSVANRATVSYDIGATTQPVIESAPGGNSAPGAGLGTDTTFVVDNRVDHVVNEVAGTYTPVAAGGVNEVLEFTVTNTGNTVQDYSLSAVDGTDPFGGVDNFDATGVIVVVDDGDGVYDAGDTATYIDELSDAVLGGVTVWVVRNIPAGQADGDISAITLSAQVAQGGVAGTQGADILTDDAASPDNTATVQIVFADGAGYTDAANDGLHSDAGAYQVQTASITVTKISTVIDDPINGPLSGGNNPKAIPGATVEYTVTISNAGTATATATNVAVSDSLNAEITAGTVAFDANGYAAAAGIQVTAPNLYGGAATALTNAAADDEGEFAANTVSVDSITLAPGESATVRFRVVIQ
jgi:uncharacterized repeat protein (TIGR01451 family)